MLLKIHHACMMTDNTNYLLFAGTKTMRRFGVYARHKKEYKDPDRGKNLFKDLTQGNVYLEQYSALFLQYLLNALRIWGNRFAKMPNGRDSVYYSTLAKLLQERVTFPDENTVEDMMSLPVSNSRT
jgi:hypothetical protein